MLRRLLSQVSLLVLLTLPTAAAAQPSGLLLGLRYEDPIPKPLPYYAGSADSLSRAAYTTLLLVEEDGVFEVRKVDGALLVPRNDRFWEVGTKRSIYNNWVEDFVWAVPEGMVPELAGIQPFNGEYCEGHRTQTIEYAGPRYLAMEQRSAGYCEGAAHPWFFNTLAVVPLDSTSHTGLDIGDVLGPKAYDALKATLVDLGEAAADIDPVFLDEPDPANWSVERRDGRWVAVARVEHAEAVESGHHTDVSLDVRLPSSFDGTMLEDELWTRIKAFAPNAYDAFSMPAGGWIAIVRPSVLTVHPYKGELLGPATLSIPLPAKAQPVMVRGGSGARLQRWIGRFAHSAQTANSSVRDSLSGGR